MRDLDRQLFEAAREGWADKIPELIAAGADVEAKHPAYCDHGGFFVGFTPLMWACGSPRSNAETVKALLAAGADVFAVSDAEVTALFYAAGGVSHFPLTPENSAQLEEGHPFWDWGGGDVERLRLILDVGGSPNESSDNCRTAVGEAAAIGDPERLRLLIERGGSVWPVPRKSCTLGQTDNEKLMAEAGMKLDQTNSKFETYAIPLFLAAESGSGECVRLILEAGFPADFVCRGENAFEHAKNVEVVEVLWEAGVRMAPGNFGFDAVDEAFEDGKFAVAQFLIDRCPERERIQFINEKLMTCSGVRMNPEGVQMLLQMGADPNYPSKDLGTPISWCCWQGDGNMGREDEVVEQTLKILISAGAEVNRPTKRDLYPIHEAVDGDWGSPTSVRVLLEHGADVNVVDGHGNTALMIAAGRGDVQCISLLLKSGADPQVKNKRGKTALDLAQDHLKVWRGIVKRPPRMVVKALNKIGINLEGMKEHHQKALAEAEEAVKLLREP